MWTLNSPRASGGRGKSSIGLRQAMMRMHHMLALAVRLFGFFLKLLGLGLDFLLFLVVFIDLLLVVLLLVGRSYIGGKLHQMALGALRLVEIPLVRGMRFLQHRLVLGGAALVADDGAHR